MDAAGLGKGLGDVGRSVVAHHLTALDALSVEPGHGAAQEAYASVLAAHQLEPLHRRAAWRR